MMEFFTLRELQGKSPPKFSLTTAWCFIFKLLLMPVGHNFTQRIGYLGDTLLPVRTKLLDFHAGRLVSEILKGEKDAAGWWI